MEAAAVGKGSVAVGEVADSVEADLVVLSTAGGGWGCEVQRCSGVLVLLAASCLTEVAHTALAAF